MPDAVIQLSLDARGWLERAEPVFCSIVNSYALAEAVARNDNQDAYVTNDFFYYSFTKSTKSLIAMNLLIRAKLGEDAQILLRSTYENYLAISFLFANPTRLDDLVEKKIGVHFGYFKHPVNSKGKKDRRKIIDPHSGEVIPSNVSVAEMVSNSRHPEDKEVHWPLYRFLSEHVHPHMIASGNYRAENQVKYSYEDSNQAIQAAIFGTYVYMLLLGEVRYFEDLDRGDLVKTTKLLKSGSDIVDKASALMKFKSPMDALPFALRTRISKLLRSRRSCGRLQPTR